MRICKSLLTIATLVMATAGVVQAQEIFDAVKANDLAKVKILLNKDPSLINIKDASGNTPLHHAAIIGSTAMAEAFLSKKADVNAVNAQGNAPLHEATRSGKEDVAALLIKKGADIRKKNAALKTPLHLAAQFDRMSIGELLIAAGAEIDSRDDYERTPFLLVARQTGNVEFGKRLLQKGANINTQDKYGDMPLNLASWRGFKPFIEFLLDHGADFDKTRGMTPTMLQWAAGCGSARLFDVVLAKAGGLPPDEREKTNLMRIAIAGGSVDIVKKCLAGGIPLAASPNRFGWTPAHAAAANGQAAMIEFLAQNGVGMNGRTLSGKSVANVAGENGRKDVLETLSRLKADLGPQRFPDLAGPYLGQAPSEGGPRLFAPDIVSSRNGDDNHGGITFLPDGTEIYWNIARRIWMTRLRDGRWTMPEIASFSKNSGDWGDDNPFISPDGKRLFFTSSRPGAVSENKENIWFVERIPAGWSEPRPVSAEVNAGPLHWGISVSQAGTLYYGGSAPGGFGGSDIYFSRLENGKYAAPVNLGSVINGKGTDHCPYIAPDESFLIFSRMDAGGAGFFISFKDKAGRWMQPVKLAEDLEGVCPIISPDGKYFFFSGDGIFWMPANFIEALRPKK